MSDYSIGPAPNYFWSDDWSSLANSFSTSFDVDEATPYRLTGHIGQVGPWRVAPATTRVTLKTAGGSVIAEGVVACDTNGPDP